MTRRELPVPAEHTGDSRGLLLVQSSLSLPAADGRLSRGAPPLRESCPYINCGHVMKERLVHIIGTSDGTWCAEGGLSESMSRRSPIRQLDGLYPARLGRDVSG